VPQMLAMCRRVAAGWLRRCQPGKVHQNHDRSDCVPHASPDAHDGSANAISWLAYACPAATWSVQLARQLQFGSKSHRQILRRV